MDTKKKDRREARKMAPGGRPSDREWKNHHELIRHLIDAGPTMHGKPGERKKKTH